MYEVLMYKTNRNFEGGEVENKQLHEASENNQVHLWAVRKVFMECVT